jgi:flagellar hook-associated protein 3 FlgL
MQVTSNIVPDILAAINQSQQALNTATEQLATGKSVNMPSDNPTASAEMVQNTIETGDVDQYTQNVSSVLSTVQTASSILSSVSTSLTQAVSIGTEGANGTNSTANLQALAAQVQSILTSVVSQANTSFGGTYLFGGTATTTPPYTPDASSATGYTYNGNTGVNSVEIGDNKTIQANVPGSQIFSNSSNSLIGALSSLATALQSGSSSDISTATAAVTSAASLVSQQQAVYGNTEDQLNAQDTSLQEDTVTLASQATSLIGISTATAATNLTEAETDNSAALAAAAKVMPDTLLNYLSTPTG